VLRYFLAAGIVGVGALAALSCSNSTGVAAGGQCFQAIDCAPGLVCIPMGSTRVCSSNLTSIETELDAGVDGASGDAGPIITTDATFTTDSGKPRVDGGSQKDTGTTPPPHDSGVDSFHASMDSGHPVDTGTPPHDTGVDSFHAPVDSGHDAGMPHDSGSGEH
jgi:hypothetical protein